MAVYLVRHGLAENNSKMLHVGRMPGVALVPEGLGRIRETAAFLKTLRIKRILTSPLERTFCTAAIIGGRLSLPVEPDWRLAERGMGLQEGMGYEEALRKFGDTSLAFWSSDPGLDALEMEPLADVTDRAVAALGDAVRGGSTVVVTHAEIIKCIIQSLTPMEPREIRRMACDNASVTRVSGGKWDRMLSYGNIEYAPDEGRHGLEPAA